MSKTSKKNNNQPVGVSVAQGGQQAPQLSASNTFQQLLKVNNPGALGASITNKDLPFWNMNDWKYQQPKQNKLSDVDAYLSNLTNFHQNLSNLKSQDLLTQFPNWSAGLQKTQKRIIGLNATIANLNNQRSQANNDQFIKLAKLDPGVTWDGQKWILPQAMENKLLKLKTPADYQKNIAQHTQLLNQSLTSDQVISYIPPIIQNIVSANEKLSAFGIGPKSQDSLPFYAGRWLDPISGQIRLLPTATQKFVSPFSRPQKMGYMQANLINKWNKFVDTQAQYFKLLHDTDVAYKQRKVDAIVNQLNRQNTANNAIKTWKDNCQKFIMKLAPPKYAQKCLPTRIGNNAKTFFDQVAECLGKKAANDAIYTQIIGVTQKYFNAIPAGNTADEIKKNLSLKNDFYTWGVQGRVQKKHIMIQLVKGGIPNQLSQAQKQVVSQLLDALKSADEKNFSQISKQDFLTLGNMMDGTGVAFQKLLQTSTVSNLLTQYRNGTFKKDAIQNKTVEQQLTQRALQGQRLWDSLDQEQQLAYRYKQYIQKAKRANGGQLPQNFPTIDKYKINGQTAFT